MSTFDIERLLGQMAADLRRLLAAEGRGQSTLVRQFTQALVVAIEEYGKRKVGRRRKAAAAPATVF